MNTIKVVGTTCRHLILNQESLNAGVPDIPKVGGIDLSHNLKVPTGSVYFYLSSFRGNCKQQRLWHSCHVLSS